MQQWLIQQKDTIRKIWGWSLITYFVFFLLSTQLLSASWWLFLGKKVATLALITFWITLTPGIMKRFMIAGPLLPIRTILMLYRRQLGITMYVLALTHYWWSRMLPILAIGGDILSLNPFELIGFMAFLLLTPVFFTSNDWSVKKLGRHWRTIHSAVYVVIWLLFIHVALQEIGTKAFITLIIAALELFSLIWAKRN